MFNRQRLRAESDLGKFSARNQLPNSSYANYSPLNDPFNSISYSIRNSLKLKPAIPPDRIRKRKMKESLFSPFNYDKISQASSNYNRIKRQLSFKQKKSLDSNPFLQESISHPLLPKRRVSNLHMENSQRNNRSHEDHNTKLNNQDKENTPSFYSKIESLDMREMSFGPRSKKISLHW